MTRPEPSESQRRWRVVTRARIQGGHGAWCVDPGGEPVRVELEIQGDGRCSYHLVQAPEGLSLTDSYHQTLDDALREAEQAYGVTPDSWTLLDEEIGAAYVRARVDAELCRITDSRRHEAVRVRLIDPEPFVRESDYGHGSFAAWTVARDTEGRTEVAFVPFWYDPWCLVWAGDPSLGPDAGWYDRLDDAIADGMWPPDEPG